MLFRSRGVGEDAGDHDVLAVEETHATDRRRGTQVCKADRMRIGILGGTGPAGSALAARLASVGYEAVIFIAGLQSISKDLYEAARVDGANAWQRFRHVTIPGLGPVAFFLIVTSILASFQSFDVIRVMTAGGPVIATRTLIYQVYQEAFGAFNAGRAAVYATILFGLMLSVTIVQVRMVERRVTYE